MVGGLSPDPNSQEQSDKTWFKGDQRLFTPTPQPPPPPGGGYSVGGGDGEARLGFSAAVANEIHADAAPADLRAAEKTKTSFSK